MIVSLIAAMAENRVIGEGNRLPWHLPEDLKRFKAVTQGHPVIMGRKTHESIGRLLPGRRNIVLSRNQEFQPLPGAERANSLEEALEWFKGTSEEVFVIGGAEIYRQALSRADQIYLTVIHHPVAGDAFFPELPPGEFLEVERVEKAEPFSFSFLKLSREGSRKNLPPRRE